MNLLLRIGGVALVSAIALIVVRSLRGSRRDSTDRKAAVGSAATRSESSQAKQAGSPGQVSGAFACRIPAAVERENERTPPALIPPMGRAPSAVGESNESSSPSSSSEVLQAGSQRMRLRSQGDAVSADVSVAAEQRDVCVSAAPGETAVETRDALPGGVSSTGASLVTQGPGETGELPRVGSGVPSHDGGPTADTDTEKPIEPCDEARAPAPPSPPVGAPRTEVEREASIRLAQNGDNMPAGDDVASEPAAAILTAPSDRAIPGDLGKPPLDAAFASAEATVRAKVPLPPSEAESPGARARGAGEPPTGPRTPRKYHLAARAPGVPREAPPDLQDREGRDRALPIEVRLVFEKAGFCMVSLLPRRALALPAELAVSGSGDPPDLIALQDEWYQDVALPDAGALLRGGIEWEGAFSDGRTVRWSLSGREIYVLCRHDDLNGFVSTPRLILGEEHEQVILCTSERLEEVRGAIELTGSPDPVMLDGANGMPLGWVGLRGVFPRTPVAPSPLGDILDALRPLAHVEIVLQGGIRLERLTWLSGYPPRIRLRGDVGAIGNVVIDGREGTLSPDGGYVIPGWNLPGQHQVWCASASRSYSIREGAEDWEAWDAYTWSMGDFSAEGERNRPAICGVLIRPSRVAHKESRTVVVPASNSLLLGAVPGQIHTCGVRRDVRAGICTGFPWFDPVWAIPADVLQCDKRVARVLLMGDPRPAGGQEPPQGAGGLGRLQRAGREQARRIEAWCSAILTAGRKGLRTEPPRADVAGLWQEYKRHAKAIWRGLR